MAKRVKPPGESIDRFARSKRHARAGGHPRNSRRKCNLVSWIPASAGMTPDLERQVSENAQIGVKRQFPAGSTMLTIRIDHAGERLLGPGKVRLMELIAEHGSISAAGRAMGMSYRRAWLLVDALNGAFREPLVEKQTGGSRGGGAGLTRLGREVVARYRRIERLAGSAGRSDVQALSAALAVGAA